MRFLTLSLLCAVLLSSTAIAEATCYSVYQAQDYKQAAQCYVQQLKSARSFDNLKMTGLSYCRLGRYKEALPYLKEAETKAKSSRDYIVLYSYISIAHSSLGDTIQELAYSMKVLNLSLKTGERKDIGSAYNNLGEYYRGQKQPQKALEFYQKALDYQEESESSATYGNMAIAYGELEDLSKAEEMYQKSITVDQNTGNYLSLGAHKTQLGIFYFTQGRNKYNEARTTLEDALIINHKSGYIASEAHALSILSIIDYREGNVAKAKERAAEGLRIAKLSGDYTTLSDANWAWNMVNGK